jgi:hypothetical protein
LQINEALENTPEGKEWWESKTIWVNIIAIISALAANFGFHFEVPPETYALFPAILAIVNVFLRNKTEKPLKPIPKIKIPKKIV